MHKNRDGYLPGAMARSVNSWLMWRRVGVFLLCVAIFCETAWLEFKAPTDVTHYQCYALLFWSGSHAASAPVCGFLHTLLPTIPALSAFHMLPVEYPPLTILPFSLPLLVPLPYYTLTFGCLILLCAGLLYVLLRRLGPPSAATLFVFYLALGACAILQVRFDLLPAACTLLALLAARYRHWTIAYVALAIGVLLKLYPIIMLPALFIAEQQAHMESDLSTESFAQMRLPALLVRLLRDVGHWRWKNVGIFLAIFVGVTAVFGLLNFQQGVVSPLRYFFQRPIQIETIYSSIFWLLSPFGAPYSIVFTFGSLNINSPLAAHLPLIGSVLELLGFVFVFMQQLRRKLDLGQAMVVLLCILISTGKVFSPQYFIWLIPLVAYVGAARFWLYGWSLLLLMTTGIYVFYYSQMPDATTAASVVQRLPGFFAVVGLRNLLFLLLALAYLCNWFRSRGISGYSRDLSDAILPTRLAT